MALRKRNEYASRRRPRGVAATLGLAAVTLALLPAPAGHLDLALVSAEAETGEGFHSHLIASPFGTIHLATFSFPKPVGTALPDFHRANFDPGGEITAAIVRGDKPMDSDAATPQAFPQVNRNLKGPRLVPRTRPDFDTPEPAAADDPGDAGEPQPEPPAEPLARHPADPAASPASESPAAPQEAGVAEDGLTPQEADGRQFTGERAGTNTSSAGEADTEPADDDAPPSIIDEESAPIRAARIYFGTAPLGGTPGRIEPWGPGETPLFDPPDAGESAAALDEPAASPASVPPPRNLTIAPKGQIEGGAKAGGGTGGADIAGEGRGPKSPAERLGLAGASRVRHEKCLADAIYFEARGESARGQMAVAQVVMNRVFSGYYPNNVCGVVYQNANRHLACQFTFACDGIPDRVNEPAAWERAKRIAHDTLDGKLWLPDVGKATHYHAYWVRPWWVHEMRKLDRIGVHTFYRPRNWGDGADAPAWGDAQATNAAAKAM